MLKKMRSTPFSIYLAYRGKAKEHGILKRATVNRISIYMTFTHKKPVFRENNKPPKIEWQGINVGSTKYCTLISINVKLAPSS